MHIKQHNQRGIGHIVLIVGIIVIAVIGFAGYKVLNSNKHTDGNGKSAEELAAIRAADQAKLTSANGNLDSWKNKCSSNGSIQMGRAPMDLSDVSIIQPLGMLAGAHVTPIDHLYFYPKDMQHRDASPVYAMHDGYIVDFEDRGQKLVDGKAASGALRIVVQYTCSFYSYYDLLTSLDPGIAAKLQSGDKHVAIKSGQVIGRVGAQSLDAAIYNLDLTLPGFINPVTYRGEPWKIHTDDFFKYFSGTTLDQMLALNPRKVAPVSGKIDYDIAGKLRGNWFQEGTNGYAGPENLARTNNIGDTGYFSGHLSIAPDSVTPSQTNISFGSYQGKPQQFVALGGKPDPATVDMSSGVVKYQLSEYRQPTLNPTVLSTDVKGTALFQLTDNGSKLKMEAFPGKTADQVSGFTTNAKIYTR